MKKTLFIGILTVLLAHTGFAACNSTLQSYLSEEDDMGVTLPLSLVCASEQGEVCIYIGDNNAGITGLPMTTSDLYRQKISNKYGKLNISLKSEAGMTSLIDYKSVEVQINNSSLLGTVEYSSRGLDPFKGIIYNPPQTLDLQCASAN